MSWISAGLSSRGSTAVGQQDFDGGELSDSDASASTWAEDFTIFEDDGGSDLEFMTTAVDVTQSEFAEAEKPSKQSIVLKTSEHTECTGHDKHDEHEAARQT